MTPPWPKPGKKSKTRGQQSAAAVNAIREQVYTRDGYQCVCAPFVGQDGIDRCGGVRTLQHRIGRGAGGSTLYDLPCNLLTMCLWHNVQAEQDADFSALCASYGWSIPKRNHVDVDPSRIPVTYNDGEFLLERDSCWRNPISLELSLSLRASQA